MSLLGRRGRYVNIPRRRWAPEHEGLIDVDHCPAGHGGEQVKVTERAVTEVLVGNRVAVVDGKAHAVLTREAGGREVAARQHRAHVRSTDERVVAVPLLRPQLEADAVERRAGTATRSHLERATD